MSLLNTIRRPVLLAMAVLPLAAGAASVRVVTDVWGGGGNGNIGAGSASGSGVFGTTIHVPFFGDVDLPMNWGDPWDIEVGLMALSNGTGDAAFMTSAKLVDIQLFDAAHRRITDFSLVAASGTDYLGAGPVGVPEPPAWALAMVAMGLCSVGRARTVRS